MFHDSKRKVPARDKAYAFLKELIIGWKLKPGEFLNERILAQQIGVSRTPIREAIGRLETEHLVKVIPGKGSFVTHISPQDIQNLFDLRQALECLATQLAANKISFDGTPAKRLCKLRDNFERLVATTDHDLETQLRVNGKFHACLAEMAQNPYLSQMLSNLSDLDKRIRISAAWIRARGKDMAREHLSIANALINGAKEEAIELMRKHISAARQEAMKLVNSI